MHESTHTCMHESKHTCTNPVQVEELDGENMYDCSGCGKDAARRKGKKAGEKEDEKGGKIPPVKSPAVKQARVGLRCCFVRTLRNAHFMYKSSRMANFAFKCNKNKYACMPVHACIHEYGMCRRGLRGDRLCM